MKRFITYIVFVIGVSMALDTIGFCLNSLMRSTEPITNILLSEAAAADASEDAGLKKDTNNSIQLELDFPKIKSGTLQVAPGGANSLCIIFSRGTNSYMFTPETGYYYSNPVISSDGKAVFFIVKTYQIIVRSNILDRVTLDFECLAQFNVPENNASMTKITHTFFLNKNTLQSIVKKKSVWVESLFRSTPNGDKLLMGITSESATNTPGDSYFLPKLYWYSFRDGRLAEQ